MLRTRLNSTIRFVSFASIAFGLFSTQAFAEACFLEEKETDRDVDDVILTDEMCLEAVKWISRLQFTGNTQWTRDELMRELRADQRIVMGIATLSGTGSEQARLSWLEEKIQAGLENAGHCSASVRCIQDNDGRVTVAMDEGPRWKCGKLLVDAKHFASSEFDPVVIQHDLTTTTFATNAVFRESSAALRKDQRRAAWITGLELRRGQPDVDQLRTNIERVCNLHGFWFSEFAVDVDRREDAHEFDLKVTFKSSGPLTRIGDITVLGAANQTPGRVLEFLSLREGLPASNKTLIDICRRLEETGRFRRVDARLDTPFDGDHRVPLVIDVIERAHALPLGEPESEINEELLRFVSWLNHWHLSGEELVMDVTMQQSEVQEALGASSSLVEGQSVEPTVEDSASADVDEEVMSLGNVVFGSLVTAVIGGPVPESVRLKLAVASDARAAAIIEPKLENGTQAPRRGVCVEDGTFLLTIAGEPNCLRHKQSESGLTFLTQFVATTTPDGAEEGRLFNSFGMSGSSGSGLINRAIISEGEFLRAIHSPKYKVVFSLTPEGHRLLTGETSSLTFDRQTGRLIRYESSDEGVNILATTEAGSCEKLLTEIREQASLQTATTYKSGLATATAGFLLAQASRECLDCDAETFGHLLELPLLAFNPETTPEDFRAAIMTSPISCFGDKRNSAFDDFMTRGTLDVLSTILDQMPTEIRPLVVATPFVSRTALGTGPPVDDKVAIESIADSLLANPALRFMLSYLYATARKMDDEHLDAATEFLAVNFNLSASSLAAVRTGVLMARTEKELTLDETVHLVLPALWFGGLKDLIDVRQVAPFGGGSDGTLPRVALHWTPGQSSGKQVREASRSRILSDGPASENNESGTPTPEFLTPQSFGPGGPSLKSDVRPVSICP